MAPDKFATYVYTKTNTITLVLVYAFLEWTLIFLLLLNSLFSYILTKFASHFALKKPCILCSRIDRIFEPQKNPNSFYWTLVCDDHAAEIGRLAYCAYHRKLVDSHNLCLDCSSSSSSSRRPLPQEGTSKCSCCDLIISHKGEPPFEFEGIRASLGLLGGAQQSKLVSNQGEDEGGIDDMDPREEDVPGSGGYSDSLSSGSEYRRLAGDERGDLVFEGEAEPLLEADAAVSIKVPDFGLFSSTTGVLPQHLDFYIEDCRLVPVESVDSADHGVKAESPDGGRKYERASHQEKVISSASGVSCGTKLVSVLQQDLQPSHAADVQEPYSAFLGQVNFDADSSLLQRQNEELTLYVDGKFAADSQATEMPSAADDAQDPGDSVFASHDSESFDEGTTSDIENGDEAVTIEQLQSALRAERKASRILFAELEEERNAAAVAANQTMSMINRLQEEKAAMQMEALHNQRMLEEQAEYDQEALQMLNEVIVKREMEKQELEMELEVYKKKVADYEERGRIRILAQKRDNGGRSRTSSVSFSNAEESDGSSMDLNGEVKEENISTNHEADEHFDETPVDTVLSFHDSLASFGVERLSILQQLKVLEERLFTLADEEEEHFQGMKPFQKFYEDEGKQFSKVDASGVEILEGGFSSINGDHHQDNRSKGIKPKQLLPLFDATDIEFEDEESNEHKHELDTAVLHKSPITKFELEKRRLAIEGEVSHVYERLQALEAEHEFLKHCVGSLRKGDRGIDLLQEILQHLYDLKKVELQARNFGDAGSL